MDHLEWIVIDGGSKLTEDGVSLEQVKVLADHFISEPDNGIYDAMNKGARLADGDYCLFLNAGDELHPGFSYDTLIGSLKSDRPGMIWGRAEVRDRKNRVYKRKTRHPRWLRYGTAVCHQAIFFDRSVLGTDPYDTNLDIAADYDLICHLYTSGAKIRLLDIPVCIFDLVGKSGQDKRLTLREESVVRKKHFRIPDLINRAMTGFKYLMWQTGTLLPLFRRTWGRFF